jgi:hypothetical protein
MSQAERWDYKDIRRIRPMRFQNVRLPRADPELRRLGSGLRFDSGNSSVSVQVVDRADRSRQRIWHSGVSDVFWAQVFEEDGVPSSGEFVLLLVRKDGEYRISGERYSAAGDRLVRQ